MPRLMDPAARGRIVLDGAGRVMIRDGVRGLTLRAVAAEVGLSPATLVHHFTDRPRLDGVLAGLWGDRRLDRIAHRARRHGALAFLPMDEGEIEDTRVWLGWCELGRSEPGVAATVAGVRADERALVASLTGTADEAELDALVAVIDGLASAVCLIEDSLSPARARDAFERHLSGGARRERPSADH